MLFNSPAFAAFLVAAFASFWIHEWWSAGSTGVRNRRNLLIIALSYVFYGWWDVRFLGLIVVSSAVDFAVGLRLEQTTGHYWRRCWLGLSLVVNLGVLATLKYFDFFLESAAAIVRSLGGSPSPMSLNLILPVGISFYTLQTLGYTIDVYRRSIPASRDPWAFFAFVAFFPQLVAGPIERADKLLPQFGRERITFREEAARDATRLILWGMVKKVVVADTCGVYADDIFGREVASATTRILGAVYFGFQIYGDFSGYSDIAIGTARLFGFDLMRNFDHPYRSTSLSEFWTRWHRSLSFWFRDYLYIPLGGSRRGPIRTLCNLLVVFVVSGLWHGAAWNFGLWGLVHGVAVCLERLWSRTGIPARMNRVARTVIGWGWTMGVVFGCWVLFRCGDPNQCRRVFVDMMSFDSFGKPDASLFGLLYVGMLVAADGWSGRAEQPIDPKTWPVVVRWSAYLIAAVAVLGHFRPLSSFIYFQF